MCFVITFEFPFRKPVDSEGKSKSSATSTQVDPVTCRSSGRSSKSEVTADLLSLSDPVPVAATSLQVSVENDSVEKHPSAAAAAALSTHNKIVQAVAGCTYNNNNIVCNNNVNPLDSLIKSIAKESFSSHNQQFEDHNIAENDVDLGAKNPQKIELQNNHTKYNSGAKKIPKDQLKCNILKGLNLSIFLNLKSK